LANEDMGRLARLTVLAAAIASVANLAGGIIFSSRLLILNGLTCVANLVTAIAGLWFYRETLKPATALAQRSSRSWSTRSSWASAWTR